LATLLGQVSKVLFPKDRPELAELPGPGAYEAAFELGDTSRVPIRIHLANGCGINRLAAALRDPLQQAGFDVCGMGNADRADYEVTLIVDRGGHREKANRVCRFFQEHWGVGQLLLQVRRHPEADVLIILGQDLASIRSPDNSIR
jgi:hypothetical protein